MSNNSTARAGVSSWNLSSVMRDFNVAWRLLMDPSVPSLLKIVLPAIALIYWISPLDLMPGLPFDDIAVLFVLARLFVAMVPKETLNRAYHGEAAPRGQTSGSQTAHSQTRHTEEEQGNVVDTTWRIVDEKERR